MNCPTCNSDTPNKVERCIQCGYTFSKEKNYRKTNRFFFIFMLLTVGVLFYLQASIPGIPGGSGEEHPSHAANSENPGQEIEVKSLLQSGKTNIVDFYSDYCGPCRRISPLLVKLAQQSEDIVVIKLDINREGKRGIDWFSPLAKQYNLRSVPHFQVYNQDGKLTHEGRSAYQEVGRLLTTAGIIQ